MLAHEKSENEPQASYRPKNLTSKAKNLEELDFDVRKSLAPRKSAEKKINFFFRKKVFDVKKSKFAHRLKRALPKFRGDRSEVRGVNGRSKFAVAAVRT